MPKQEVTRDADSELSLEEWLPVLREHTSRALRTTGRFASGMARIYVAMRPLATLVNRHSDITEQELHAALDALFAALREHPLNEQLREITRRLREDKVLPNEESTENLLRFLIDQFTARSVIPIPDQVTEEFWTFFNGVLSEPEMQGLGEVSLDVMRIMLGAYEPLLVQVINQLKQMRRTNNVQMRELFGQTGVLRSDLDIFRRQIGALAYIREFFDTDPEDLQAQAAVVAQMVREFGPFFIKMAQVAAAGSDFLPEEISDALAVFQEDVEPMAPWEVEQAFRESFGESPAKRYYDFDASKPLKSGSIASVYVARKPVTGKRGRQELKTVVVKVGRHNLEREFLIGKTVIKLAILSSQYWAPHSKLSPFLASWLDQVDVFVEGFRAELDFEAEALVQQKFAERARFTGGWHVPTVYASTRRVIEMEYIATGRGLGSVFRDMPPRKSVKARREVGRAFLHAVMSHLLVYQEFHGDLHPGNLMVDSKQRLYFIDWGNSVDIRDIWRPALSYLQAVFTGDAFAITEAMIQMGTRPTELRAREQEILGLVEEAVATANLGASDRHPLLALYEDGVDGLRQRLDLAIQLGTLMGRQGITLSTEYMHLSRSVTAMVGSYVGIYGGVSRLALAQDVAQVLLQFPAREGFRQAGGYRRRLLRQVARDLPQMRVTFVRKDASAST